MRLKLTKIGSHPAVAYALEEVAKYVHIMDPALEIDEFAADECERETVLSESCDTVVFAVGLGVDESEDTRVLISVENGKGKITGSSPNAVLIAAYRFLYALGCRFPTPEDDGDIIPHRNLTLADLTVHMEEAPSYRHRGIVLEGCLDYAQAKKMIQWMPKIGLNEYFIQYLTPRQYFARVYDHYGDSLTIPETLRLQKRLVEEIKKRDLIYHAVGHTWQCVPFGIEGTYGEIKSFPESARKYLALVNGKRDLMYHNPLETEVCYSDPEVREIIIRAVIKYCKEHPEVDYLHFWQSDGGNNCCECEKCRDKTAADLYVPLLNDLDEALTREGIGTRIVFLCYSNLTWAPLYARLKNEDRFVFMATIAHSFSKPINQTDRKPNPPPYRLNKNRVPKNNADSIAMVQKWQDIFSGDSFLFDYNQIWDHYKDPGYMHCAERIAGDNRLLSELHLNGLHSCQVTQAGSPTWLPTYTHGLSLWSDQLSFDDIADDYFKAVFGDEAEAARGWLQMLSDEFDPPYLRHEKEEISEEARVKYEKLAETIRAKLPELRKRGETSRPWMRMYYHAELDVLLAEGLSRRAAGDLEGAKKKAEEIHDAAFARYDDNFGALDTLIYTEVIKMILTSELTTFSRVIESEQ